MASIVIHLGVAYRIAQQSGLLSGKIQTEGSYYLGVIAPDAVNLDGFASRQVRWASHLRERTPREWYASAGKFYRKQLKNGFPDRDLLLGYLVHTLTDAAFDETLHDPIWAAAGKMSSLRGENLESNDAGWEECFRFDRSQLAMPWWTQTVRPALAAGKPQEIGTIPAELLGRYQDHLLYLYERELPREKPQVITPEMVWLLGDYVESILKPML